MKYKKYHYDHFQLHLVSTKKFKTILVKINFKRPLRKEEITKRNFLSDLMIRSTKKYNSERFMAIATENLYGMNFNSYSVTSGNYSLLSFNAMFLDKKYTEDSIVEEVFDFFHEVLFAPNIQNGKFENKAFSLTKKCMRDELVSIKENPSRLSNSHLYDAIDPDSILAYHSEGYLEDLTKITRENLVSYYEDVLKNDVVDIFIIGDVDESIADIILEKLPFQNPKKENGNHYVTDIRERKEVQILKEKSKFTQSRLSLAYNIKEMTPFERNYVSYIYSSILGGGADSKLFRTVREKNSLCYSIGSSVNRIFELLLIRLGLDGKKQEKAVTLIKQCVEDMEKGKFTEEEIEKAKIIYESSLKEVYDNPFNLLNIYVSKEYLQTDDIEKRLEEIKKVGKKELLTFAKKVKLNTIYLLEGKEKHGKKLK